MKDYIYLVEINNGHIQDRATADNENENTLLKMAMMMAPRDQLWNHVPIKDSTGRLQTVYYCVSDLYVLIDSPFELGVSGQNRPDPSYTLGQILGLI